MNGIMLILGIAIAIVVVFAVTIGEFILESVSIVLIGIIVIYIIVEALITYSVIRETELLTHKLEYVLTAIVRTIFVSLGFYKSTRNLLGVEEHTIWVVFTSIEIILEFIWILGIWCLVFFGSYLTSFAAISGNKKNIVTICFIPLILVIVGYFVAIKYLLYLL